MWGGEGSKQCPEPPQISIWCSACEREIKEIFTTRVSMTGGRHCCNYPPITIKITLMTSASGSLQMAHMHVTSGPRNQRVAVYFVFCRLYPFSLFFLTIALYRRCGLALSYDVRGFVGPKKKTIVGLLVFNPLCRERVLRYCVRNLSPAWGTGTEQAMQKGYRTGPPAYVVWLLSYRLGSWNRFLALQQRDLSFGLCLMALCVYL